MSKPLYRSYRLVIILLTWLYLVTVPGLAFSTLNFASVCMQNTTSTNQENSGRCVSGNFTWSSEIKSALFAGYSYGAIVVVLFCGWAADVLGAKIIMIFGSVLGLLSTVLLPVGATYGDWKAVLVLRIILGLGAAPAWPAVARVAAVWFPNNEKSIAMGIASTGFASGTFICDMVSGALCCAFDWTAVFYFGAVVIFVNLVLIVTLFSSDPKDSKWISKAERRYILNQRSMQADSKSSDGFRTSQNDKNTPKSKTPWIQIITSLPVLAVIINGYSERTIQFFTLMYLPTYLNDALGVSTTENGIYSALPELFQIIGRALAGLAADKVHFFREKPTWNAKIFNTFAFLCVIGVLVGLIFVKPGQSWLVTIYMCLQFFLGSFVIAGYFRSVVTIAPKYSGTIIGASTFGAFLAAIVLPYLKEALVKHGESLDEWRNVFFLIIGILVLAMLFFLIFGTTETQDWAKENEDQTSPVDTPLEKITKF